jgi:hypothetical protein
VGCNDLVPERPEKAKVVAKSNTDVVDELAAISRRFMDNVPKENYEVNIVEGGKTLVLRARDWRGDVKKTDSLINPAIGELYFKFQYSNTQRDKGWLDYDFENLFYKAIYHVVNGKWQLQEILGEASDAKGQYYSVTERFPPKSRVIKNILPNNF